MSGNRLEVWGLAMSLVVMGAAGCATKKYVRNQTAPLVEHTDQLEGKTAENNRRIRSTDERAQAGIRQAQGTAEAAGQSAEGANKTAGKAESAANEAVHRADSLDSVIKGLDNYKPVADVTVTFGFDKSVLTRNDREQLDSFAARVGSSRSYILEVTGGTDSTGSAQYNYELSQRRADAVVQYLAARHGIAAHRFYLIGIGKDNEVASNTSPQGRKRNRRVTVQLLSNLAAPGDMGVSH
jgi:outer membrane protein OmpA-like peptidoglycan-associated protein